MRCTIYLVRHGIAEDASRGERDADRRLTRDGQHKMRQIADGLRRLGITPRVILASPLRRAAETAAILQSTLTPDAAVQSYDALAPGHEAGEVVSGLAAYRGATALVLVGHQPGVGEVSSYLLTGSATQVAFDFKKGGAAAIAVGALPPRTPGVLLWFATPKQLRAVPPA